MLLNEGSMLRRWVEGWARFSVRHPWLCAFGWISLTVLAVWVASGLVLKTDLAALLPRTYPSVRELDRVKEKVGGLERIVLVIESPDSAANHRFAVEIGERLERRPEISFVEWSRDLSFFEDNKLLYIDYADLVDIYRRVSSKAQMDVFSEPLDFRDIERKYARSDSAKKDEWATADGTIRLVMAYPKGQSANMTTARALIAMSRDEVAALDPHGFNPQMEVYYGGEFKNRVDEYDVILNDIKSTALIAITGIILLISLYFRQFFAWLFIGYPLIAGLSWTFAITELAIGNLNLITGFLIAVLAGLGIDFGIHVFSRYIEERGHGHELAEAIRLAVINTGAALATSATTTVAAFYSLMITDFKGFSEFGFIAGTGVLLTLVAVLLTFPAFITIGERLHLVRHRHGVKEWRKSTAPLPFARPILLIFSIVLVAAVACVAVYPRMQFEYDFTNLRANLESSNLVKAKISRIQQMETAPAAVVAEDSAARQEIMNVLKAYKTGDTLTPTIKEVRTVESFLPADQDRKMKLITRLQRVVKGREDKLLAGQTEITPGELDQWLNVRPVTVGDLPEYLTRKFRGPDGSLGQFVMIGTTAQLRDGKQAIEFANDVRKVETPHHGTFYSSGSAIIFADMLLVMEHDSVIAISITFLVVLGIVLLDFGKIRTAAIIWVPVILGVLGVEVLDYLNVSFNFNILRASEALVGLVVVLVLIVAFVDFPSFRAAAIVMSPLLGGVAVLLGAMALFNIKLNFYNMVVLPSIIGMGIDNGVHLYHRYLEEGPGSMRYVMRTTGGAVFMASLTTMVGFSGMITAEHQGLNSMGDVAIIGMLSCLVMSVIFLPMLLTYRETRLGHPSDNGSGAVCGGKPEEQARDTSVIVASETEG